MCKRFYCRIYIVWDLQFFILFFQMFLFAIFCLVAFATALPAPLSSDLAEPEGNELHTNAVGLSAGQEEPEILSLIPEPPELEPLIIVEVENVEQEEKKGDEIDSNGIEVINVTPEEVQVTTGETKPPSVFTNIVTFLLNPSSWPSWSNFSFQPNWSIPKFPSFSNIFDRQVAYANPIQPSYKYVVL